MEIQRVTVALQRAADYSKEVRCLIRAVGYINSVLDLVFAISLDRIPIKRSVRKKEFKR